MHLLKATQSTNYRIQVWCLACFIVEATLNSYPHLPLWNILLYYYIQNYHSSDA